MVVYGERGNSVVRVKRKCCSYVQRRLDRYQNTIYPCLRCGRKTISDFILISL